MRALFFNEGDLDTHVLGHGRLDAFAALAGLLREAVVVHRERTHGGASPRLAPDLAA